MFLIKNNNLTAVLFICLIAISAFVMIESVSANNADILNNGAADETSMDFAVYDNNIGKSNVNGINYTVYYDSSDLNNNIGKSNVNNINFAEDNLNSNIPDNSHISSSDLSNSSNCNDGLESSLISSGTDNSLKSILKESNEGVGLVSSVDVGFVDNGDIGLAPTKDILQNSNENVFYVSNDGSDSNSGLSHEDAFLTINNALNNIKSSIASNNIIYLSQGIYLEENNFTSMGNIILIGAGINKTFLNGENSHRIAKIYGSNITFVNMSFVNGFEHSGGAIYNEGNLTLINCSFLNNKASGGTSTNHSNFTNGGAIYNAGKLTVEGSSFDNSIAGGLYIETAYGGAIYNIGELSVNNSKFSNNGIDTFMIWTMDGHFSSWNSTQEGGAIYSHSDNLLVSNSVFSNNNIGCFEFNTKNGTYFLSFSKGGAVYIDGNNCRILNSSFLNNTADNGGAVYFIGNNNQFDFCVFNNNSAFMGGAIMTLDYELNGYAYLTFSNLTNNVYSNLTISNSVFEDNYIIILHDLEINFITGYGAGAGYLKIDNISIVNSSFKSNGLKDREDYFTWHQSFLKENYCHSGALFLYGQSSVVDNSSFTENIGDVGGAIQNFGFDTRILSSTFINNTADLWDGGAIFHSIGDLLVDNCYFDSNKAPRNGGTIQASYDYSNTYLFEQKSVYNNSVFVNSNASYGGAIFDTANSVIYENLLFANNSANYGGAVYSQGFSNSYKNSTFINNSALGKDYSNGGAVYQYGSNALLDSCRFMDNIADMEGGAVFNLGESSLLINNTFDKNSAFKGGSVYLSGSGGRFQENTISSSFAVNGGGLFNANANLICLNNTFNNCSANISGAAIYNLVSTLELYANSMNNCKANLSGLGAGNYVYTCGDISYLVVSFSDNGSFNIVDNRTVVLVASITDNMGNPITGGNFSFILFNKSNNNSTLNYNINGSGSSVGDGSVGSGSSVGDGSVGSGSSVADSSYGSDYSNNNDNVGYGESTIIGICDVIEGRASMEYGLIMELGTSYLISGTYSYGAEPISTQMASLNSVLSTKIYFASNLFDNRIIYNDSLDYELILLDSQNEYIPNSEVLVYLDGVYTKSLFTNDVGYLNDSISNILIKGKHHYSFIYGGDIFHNRFVYDLDFEVFYNNTYYYDDILLSFVDMRYAIIKTDVDNPLTYEFLLSHANGDALSQVSTPRYFMAYENSESFEIIDTYDYMGNVRGVDGLFHYLVDIAGNENKVPTTSDVGTFLIELNKNEPGLYEYTVCFIGDLVKQFDSGMHNHVTEEDNYYNPCNISFILIIDDPNAHISTNINYTSADVITEVDFPYYKFNLTDLNANPLGSREIRIYDNGVYQGSAVTDFEGSADFLFPDMLDLGLHLIEFVYLGDGDYLSTYNVFELNVVENPEKDSVVFYNKTSLNLAGPDNNLTVQLADSYGNNLSNQSIEIELLFNPSDLNTFRFGGFDKNTYLFLDNQFAYAKNFTLVSDENGQFDVPLELGAGNYLIKCSYGGNKWYLPNERRFNLTVEKIGTLLFGQSSINVLMNESYLTVVLSTDDLRLLSDSKIRYIVLTEDDNISFNISSLANSTIDELSSYIAGLDNYYTSFYAFTNESSVSILKISLPVGKYTLVTVYEGDIWFNGSALITNLTVFGQASRLETPQNTVIKKQGYYSVKLLDSDNNPLAGEMINITVNGESVLRYTDLNGEARLEIDLDYGNYTVISQFKGNINYSSAYVSSNLFVVDEDYKYPSSLKVISPTIYRSEGHYQIVLRGMDDVNLVNRTVITNINGSGYTSFTDGDGMIDLDYNFTIGTYMIVSWFEGDDNYQNSSISFILTVVPEDAAATVLNSSIYWVLKGKGNVYTVNLQDKIQNPIANETILFTINDNQEYYAKTDINGNANLIINLDPGSYNINSYFRGSDVYFASSCFSKLVVLPLDNETNGSDVINSSNASAGVDSGSGVNGSSNGGAGVDSGSGVNGSSNGGAGVNNSSGDIGSNITNSGSESVNSTNSSSSQSVNSTNSGSESVNFTNSSSSQSVNSTNSSSSDTNNKSKISTKIIANNLVKYYKNSKNLVICLKTSDNKVIAGKYVSIKINGKTYKQATDKNGKLTLLINLKKGTYSLGIKFTGDKTYRSSSKKVTVKVVIPSVKAVKTTVKKGKKLQILFKNYKGGLIKKQKVFIKIKGKTYTLKTNNKGIASLSLKLKKGTYTVSTGLKNTNSYGKYTKSFRIRVN